MNNEIKSVIKLSHSNDYRDAFIDPSVRLFVPLDAEGNLVSIERSVKLQCWVPGEPNVEIPIFTTFSPSAISNLWLKKDSDHQFFSVPRCAAYVTLKKMDEWLHTLHRHEAGDVDNITLHQ